MCLGQIGFRLVKLKSFLISAVLHRVKMPLGEIDQELLSGSIAHVRNPLVCAGYSRVYPSSKALAGEIDL